jgi:glycosyltransferase involved in cell wall biosynthesis
MKNRIGLFTTLGVGIATWDRIGTLGRELMLYRKLSNYGWHIHIFSFDCANEIEKLKGRPELKGLTVHACYPKWLLCRFSFVYALVIPFLFWRVGRHMSVVKTNQAHSGWHALWAARIWGAKLLSRSGYVLGEQLSNRGKESYGFHENWRKFTERLVMCNADVCFVTTKKLVLWCQDNYRCKNVLMIPNNIDIDVFKPNKKAVDGNPPTIIAVGRLHPCKRIDMLIRALHGVRCKLVLVGEGGEVESLKRVAIEQKVSVEFLGKINNEKLPPLMQLADIYVICSEYEGHPKALAEAMACGCACVGTRSPGIVNQIQHRVNGFICDGTVESLRDAIKVVLRDQALRHQISEGARCSAVQSFSLESLATQEHEVLCGLLKKRIANSI